MKAEVLINGGWKIGWVLAGLAMFTASPKRVQYRGAPGHYEIQVENLFGPILWTENIYPSLLNCLKAQRAMLQKTLDRLDKRIAEVEGET